jgi:hypothetical protein
MFARYNLMRTLCSVMVLLMFVIVNCTVSYASVGRESAAVAPVRQLPANFQALPGPQAVVPIPFEVVNGDPGSVQLRFTNPPLEIGSGNISGQEYSTIGLSGEGATLDPGAPNLPRVSRLVMIANTGQVELTVANQTYHVQTLNAPPAPTIVEGENDGTVTAAVPRTSIYSSEEWYPSNIAEISEPMTLRDVRFVVVTVYPVQVNPVNNQIRVYDNIEVAVTNIGGVGEREIQITPTSITPGFKKLYRAFENFENSTLDELPVVPGKQLIICGDDTSIIGSVRSLVNWRRKKGIDAYYATTTTAGGTDAASIRTYISNQYTGSNGQLEFVTLAGDPVGVGAYDLNTDGTQLDNYYGAMAGGPNADPLPDIAVGRLPALNSTQLNAMISKTIQYESDPYVADTTWFTRTWCAAHTGAWPNNVMSNPSTKEYTRQIMLAHGVTSAELTVFPSSMDQTSLNSHINPGVSVFNDRMSWISEFTPDMLSGLTNGRKLPFVMVITCGTGSISGGSALSEEWVRQGTGNNPVGAIGCVGLSGAGTHVPYNNIIDAGVMYGFYVQDIEEQGTALIAGKLQMLKNYYGFDTYYENFCYWANLIGDPAVPVWRQVPHTPQVTRPVAVNTGTNNISVSVAFGTQPVEGALVGLVKGTETFARGYTDGQGNLNLPVTLSTSGYLSIVVSRKDIDTYVDSIEVTTADASLGLSSVTVDDDNVGGTVGDGNGVLNPGETVDLDIRLQNTGAVDMVTGISGTLATTNPGASIQTATSAYPNIAVGATASPTTKFRVVASAVFNNEPVTFYLTASSSAGTQSIRVDLTPVAGDVAYVSHDFLDGNARLDPGDNGDLTVTIRNSGNRSLLNAHGILRSRDPHVTVTDSLATFGTLTAATNATNTTDHFVVSASARTPGGYRALMQLVITDDNGIRDSINLVDVAGNAALQIGVAATTVPTGPDAYGYYAYDNTETQPTGCASLYEWEEIVPELGGNGTLLTNSDTGEDQDLSRVDSLPFNFRFYGHSFDRITICSNGWVAFGAQTNADARNYRMGTPIGPTNMIAAYWDDLVTTGITNPGVWVWRDAALARYVVEWRTRTRNTSVDEVFEAILLDPEVYSSPNGDGKILVQYQTVNVSQNGDIGGTNDNEYASVGIENLDHSIGVDYSYWGTYAPTAAPLVAGRAIMFTTDSAGVLPHVLALLSPNGGETWYQHTTDTVRWIGGDPLDNVRIDLSRNGTAGPWVSLFTSTPNDGEQPVPVNTPASSTCRIKISMVATATEADTSLADFAIGTLKVLSPNGNEVWFVDSVATVSWQGGDPTGTVRVEMSRDSLNGPWQTVTASTANTGTYAFTVPGPTSPECRIRVTSNSDATDTDVSNANFFIRAVRTVYLEDFEAGAPGWTHTGITHDGRAWLDAWRLSGARIHGGNAAYATSDSVTGLYSNWSDAVLTSPVIPSLPATSTLQFYHQIVGELSTTYPDSAYDGGFLEISVNGGAFNQFTPTGGYNKIFRWCKNNGNTVPATGPLRGHPCYSGTIPAWTQVQADLSAYAGQSVQFRFRFGSDSANVNAGWFIDDVKIFAPIVIPRSLTIAVSGTNLILRWAADNNTHYRVYSSTDVSRPFDVWVADTDTNVLTIPGGAADPRRFYTVVGWDGF